MFEKNFSINEERKMEDLLEDRENLIHYLHSQFKDSKKKANFLNLDIIRTY